MNTNITFFIVPGFKQKINDCEFIWLSEFLKTKGIKVVLVPIKWNNRVMSDYIRQFKEFYSLNKSETNYILGFSYGAVIAFSTANDLLPKKIFLCSLSSDFAEDIKSMKTWIKKYVGKNRLDDSQKRSGRIIARKLIVPSVVFYGEKEGKQYPQLKIRCEETAKIAKNSKLVVVSNSPHQINFPEYIKAIKKELVDIF